MKNPGKKFEDVFKKSINKEKHLLLRIPDPPQSFIKSEYSKFSNENPCDFVLFDTDTKLMCLLELKTTKYKSMNFQIDKEDKQQKMIKYHQINSLTNFSHYDGVVAGFIFNFRDEDKKLERTYFQRVVDFNNMINNLDKKSFNEMDLFLNNAIKIHGIKKRVNYKWDIEGLLYNIVKEGMKHE